jgi:hypothetical protein
LFIYFSYLEFFKSICNVASLRQDFIAIYKDTGAKYEEFVDTVEQGVFDKILQQFKDANRFLFFINLIF